MKKITALLLALLMALSLCSFACAEEQPTLVRFWHNRSSGANLEACEKAVDEFNKTIGKEKNIFVEATYQGGYPDLYAKCQLASQTEETPTVAVIGNTYVVNLMQDDLLVDMAPYAAATGFDVNNLLDCFQQIEGNTDGHLYSLPYVRSTPVLYYNKTIADELNLTAPNTMEDLENFARALTLRDPATGEITRYGFEVLGDFGFVNAAWLWELGEPMLSTEGTSPALDGTSMLNMLTLWRKWVDEGICRPKDSANASSTASAMLVQGKLCSYMASSGSMKNLLKSMEEAGYELGVVYQPSFDPSKRTCEVGGGQLTLMAPGNDEKTLAAGWEFLQFLMSDEQVFNNSMATGYLPITKSVANYDKMQAFWAENPTYKVPFDQMMNYGVCQEYPSFPDLQEFIANIEAACSYLIQEQSITPEQAVQQMKDSNAHLF